MTGREQRGRLAAYLRTRRELTSAPENSLTADLRRRVRWLRREEVAHIAGVSRDYYVRLEQGRDQHPSDAVLKALVQALNLDADSLTYMLELVRAPVAPRPTSFHDQPSPALLALLRSWSDVPAFLQTRFHDTIACTPLAAALHPALRQDGNLLRLLFLDPDERAMTPDWPEAATTAVADLRARAATSAEHPRLTGLVGELAMQSSEFAGLWARQDVQVKRSGLKRLHHPRAGSLSLGYETFDVNSEPSQMLVFYVSLPGSFEERALHDLRATLTDPVTPVQLPITS